MPKAADFSAIYGIRHIASGRIYVGSAVRTNARWRHHRSQLQRGTHHTATCKRHGINTAQRLSNSLCWKSYRLPTTF